MEDVLLDILELLDLALAFLRQNWTRHGVKHNKEKPVVSLIYSWSSLDMSCNTCFMFFLSTPRRLYRTIAGLILLSLSTSLLTLLTALMSYGLLASRHSLSAKASSNMRVLLAASLGKSTEDNDLAS